MIDRRLTAQDIQDSLRMSGNVIRYHAWPTLQVQTVAAHTWQVWRIYRDIFGELPLKVSEYIMFHDCAEVQSGDVPFLFKKKWSPAMKNEWRSHENNVMTSLGCPNHDLSDYQRYKVKVCDILEMTEFAKEEILMGNRFAEPVFDRTLQEVQYFVDELEVQDKKSVKKYISRLAND